NDAAMMIAEHVGGSVDHFVEMMNEEAASIGATSSHFMNPHGLTNPEHYTSVYDIYLIYNTALKYDIFQDIISRKNYYAEYTRSDGSEGAVTWESTNHYFTNEAEAPDDVVIYGGKTGTTDDAGACLSLLSKDLYGNPYLSIILHANDKDALYQEMNQVLSLIGATDS
ncbi:MAG: D-alanyl-D-alanine carboxypeptidase family protein, partial [Lachnospiraceae bacterium]